MTTFVEIPEYRYKIARRKKVAGVGINDAPYKVTNKKVMCPYYSVWLRMVRRCYVPFKGWEDCTVHNEWHYFMHFRKWMEAQDWKNKCLDKDILVLGNKEYGPNTCVFVSTYVNSIFQKYMENRKMPKGIRFDKNCKKYHARFGTLGINISLGYFSSILEANDAYIKAKAQILADEFKNISDTRVKNGLFNLLVDLNTINKNRIDKMYSSIKSY